LLFLSLKQAIEARRKVRMEPLFEAWNGTPPTKQVGRIVYFLLEATRTEFEVREAIVTRSCNRRSQELRCRQIQENLRYNQAVSRLKDKYHGAEDAF